MKKRTKVILIVLAAVLVCLAGGLWYVWDMMTRPLYKPGSLKNVVVQASPQTGDSMYWNMEKDLQALQHEFIRFYAEAAKSGGKSLPNIPSWQDGAGGWMIWANYFSMGAKHDYTQALRAVQAPVLILHGTADLQSESGSRTYAAAFPNTRFEIIQGAGHFPFFDRPQEFAAAVRRFLHELKQ